MVQFPLVRLSVIVRSYDDIGTLCESGAAEIGSRALVRRLEPEATPTGYHGEPATGDGP